jgi:hypothetical protein
LTGRAADQISSSPAGATIILDQTPDSKTIADKCWQGIPRNNTFLIFPGDRLHGVLPCPGNQQTGPGSDQAIPSTKTLVKSWKTPFTSTSAAPSHRLTFMVGFWTRNVPAAMKNRRLYGPCGPLPPATKEHTWVQEIQQGYGKGCNNQRPGAPKLMVASPLPCVSPAWESFEANNTNPPLCIPHNIDHRFFVRDAPQCFRQSLFEDRETEYKL